jgi:hypothetical protein
MSRLSLAWKILLTGQLPDVPPPPPPPSSLTAPTVVVAPPASVDVGPSPMVGPLIKLRDDVQGAAGSLDAMAGRAMLKVAAELAAIVALERVVTLDQDGPFDPRRQAAISGMVTEDPAQDQQVASTVRPGYERDGVLIRRQDVIVYHLRGRSPG